MSVRETPCCVMEEPVLIQKGALSVNVPQDTRSMLMALFVKVGPNLYSSYVHTLPHWVQHIRIYLKECTQQRRKIVRSLIIWFLQTKC